ncbi:T9SS type A sorting domain-containing protein [Apibacter sp. ESL0404]|uniref:T9SS type A sorting domain-containing protein n=1 Tax=Apibacter sp. ESL0404 TaxID=2704651 RepID=UPI001C6A46A8|nr:T9SS type A sorting domain-containing protein [Apibacter sp. ESL0404]QYN50751.1 T9SS type A sorting domain-containing protein [Apibacter sp. ESL0404]
MKHFLHFIICFLIFQNNSISQTLDYTSTSNQIPEKEYQALIDIYNQLNGSNWDGFENWKRWNITENNLHEIPWSGVTVENGHVTKLSLEYFNNVKGKLPVSIKNLEYLKTLDLSINSIEQENDYQGTDWSILSGLKNLNTLALNGCNIQGPLPESWGDLQNLESLSIAFANVTQINSTIGDMSSLTTLIIAGNQIQELPTSISKCKFGFLDLSFNYLKKVPKELEEVKTLYNLRLNENQISEIEGFLPYSIGNYDLRHQKITLPLLEYKGEDIKISLPQIFSYNRDKNDFSYAAEIYPVIRDSIIESSFLEFNQGVLTISKELLATINEGDDIYFFQSTYHQNGTIMGGNILRFDEVKVDNSLSIDEIEIADTKTLKLVPVPNKGIFTLLMKGKEGNFNLSIYDLSGRKIYGEEKIKVTDNFKKLINISPIQSGVYYLILHNSKEAYKLKFTVE